VLAGRCGQGICLSVSAVVVAFGLLRSHDSMSDLELAQVWVGANYKCCVRSYYDQCFFQCQWNPACTAGSYLSSTCYDRDCPRVLYPLNCNAVGFISSKTVDRCTATGNILYIPCAPNLSRCEFTTMGVNWYPVVKCVATDNLCSGQYGSTCD
jgi:hypothetical protein